MMLALLAPRLEYLGAEGLNELVLDLNGGPTDSLAIDVPDMPNILDGSIHDHDFHLYGATTAALCGGDNISFANLVRLCS